MDASPDSLGQVNWHRTITSDTSGVVTQSGVGVQFLQGPGLALPQFSFIGSFGEGALPVNPSFLRRILSSNTFCRRPNDIRPGSWVTIGGPAKSKWGPNLSADSRSFIQLGWRLHHQRFRW